MPPTSHDSDARAIRLYSSAVRAVTADQEAGPGCPTFHTAKADQSRRRPLLTRPRHVSMPFDPFNRVLDLIELQHYDDADALLEISKPDGRSGRLVHEGLATWARHAVRLYRHRFIVDMAAAGAQDVAAVHPWVHQIRGAGAGSRTHELCIWGRAYTYRSTRGQTRELRIPVMRQAGDRERSDAEKAVIAYVVAVGSLVDTAAFEAAKGRYLSGVPFPLLPPTSSVPGAQPPDHVRVLEVDCTAGETRPLFQGDVGEAEAYFAEHGRPAILALFRSTERRPGYDCLECKEQNLCNRLPRSPGLLGIHDTSRPRRVFAATSGRYQADCAAMEHFRSLRLPVDETRETTSAVRQGKAVHAWLQRQHDRVPRRPCTADDLPADPGDWTAGAWHLEGLEARNAAAMLTAHIDVCPYLGLSPDAPAHPEQVIATDDPQSGTLVVARADLVYRRNHSWIYRESKTTSSARIPDGGSLLSEYPQAAMAVLLYEAGAIPLGPLSAVEVEILTPEGPDLRVLNPRSSLAREEARRTIRSLALAWHADTAHLAAPGTVCRRCSYHRWCPSAERQAEVSK